MCLPWNLRVFRIKDDADPGLRDLCAVVAIDKYTRTTEILWRKRDSVATL